VIVFVSADRTWRLEQTAKGIRLLQGGGALGWRLMAEVRTVAELERWLAEHGDPVSEWIRS
jgi:hypothetical protein